MMKRSIGAAVRSPLVLALAVLVGAGIALGPHSSAEEAAPGHANRMPGMDLSAEQARGPSIVLGEEGSLPSLVGAVQWLNSPPLTAEGLRGKVVLVDFWTYTCINSLRAIPHLEAWAEKYKNSGLVVIGVHAPEFAFERDPSRVAKAVRDLKLTYAVAVDSKHAIWNAFENQIWPADYFIDARGKIRFHHFGEGNYEESERVIQQLLAEKKGTTPPDGLVQVAGDGVLAPPNFSTMGSPETYVGYARQENYASPQRISKNKRDRYTSSLKPRVNEWGLEGEWTVGEEQARLTSAPGKIVFRFHARDLHLVLGPQADGKPARFRVLLDGTSPLEDHGADVDSQGNGVVTDYRLYQLVRQKGNVEDRTFLIEFLDPGVQAFVFTFG